ncbi:hypothetical protein EVAR_6228_1 [Eumeta japonica]|uniref:Uncharacterized protein n=1 Tax=Eumeta variegata TaxID=151549 RepID=A0A4C1TB05_EUMVA|nr:hypothetical protein EVAR_6228_1 [Eumeta japonica]
MERASISRILHRPDATPTQRGQRRLNQVTHHNYKPWRIVVSGLKASGWRAELGAGTAAGWRQDRDQDRACDRNYKQEP